MKKVTTLKESASIIIAALSGFNFNKSYDYNLLLLKRIKTANSFANSFVFPGGGIESADSNLKWQELFKNFGCNEENFKSLFVNLKKRPQIFYSPENELPREISLRICAIRETFEECGILFCKKCDNIVSNVADNIYFSHNELKYWQNRVHSDANEFYNLCETLQCLPNLWILHEWSNWITPIISTSKTRFNTAFFITCLPQIPISNIEYNEIEELRWSTLENIKSLKISLPPPQQYEISRIKKYHTLDSLLHFALENSKNGIEQYFPISIILLDGIAYLLPGDSMYPEKVNLQNQQPLKKSMTIKQFRDISPITNRMEFFNNQK